MNSSAKHRKEIGETFLAWKQKPLLQQVYKRFHRKILENLSPVDGQTLELGSGIGAIKETIPHCITSDMFLSDWVDRQENAYSLSFDDASVSNLILFDVWHHLEYPAQALREFKRVLVPGGRLIIFDPAAFSVLGFIVYSLLHHEPVFGKESWDLRNRPTPEVYFAAQGNCWKHFVRKQVPESLWGTWEIQNVHWEAALDYLLSGGFRQRQWVSLEVASQIFKISEKFLDKIPMLFATRMLVSLSPKY